MAQSINPQFKRIMQVFGVAEEDAIPPVKKLTVKIYFDYIKQNLTCPCLLTGIESMGSFGWEERFEFGYGSEDEYEETRQEEGSHLDVYELKEFDAIAREWDIEVNVQRIPGHKKFTIPLSELQSTDETSPNYQLLKDYTVWFVNWQ